MGHAPARLPVSVLAEATARFGETYAELLRYGSVTVDANGCWVWGESRRYANTGYGRAYNPELQKVQLAHRRSWELANGRAIPDGMVVCHQCDNRPCVNPDHLVVGTQARNLREARDRGRSRPGEYQRNKTHCRNGHAYTAENTYHRPNGHRICATCHKAMAQRQRDQRNAGRVA